MPFVHIHWYEGRTDEQKAEIASGSKRRWSRSPGPPEHCWVKFSTRESTSSSASLAASDRDPRSRPSIVPRLRRRRRRRPRWPGPRRRGRPCSRAASSSSASPPRRQLDPVGDLEAGLFARVLDGVDDLAGEALAAQLLVELELERDGVAGLGLDLVALERLQGEGRCRRRPSVWSSPSTLIPTRRRRLDHLGDVGGVERLDRGGDLRHLLAEAGAERAVVGLDRVADQLGLLGDEVELLDVELGA